MMKLKKLGAMLLAAVLVTSIPTNAFAANTWTAEVESTHYYWQRSYNDGVESGEWVQTANYKSNYNSKGRYEGYVDTYQNYVGYDETTYEPIYEDVVSSCKYSYDKKGKLKAITWYQDGVLTSSRKSYKYDSKGHNTSYVDYNENGEKVYTTKISYDKNGYTSQRKETWANGKAKALTTYKDGRTTKSVSYDTNGVKTSERKYDAKGYATKATNYSEGKVSSTYTYKNTYKNNVRSKCVSTYKSNTDDTVRTTVTTYYTSGAKLGWIKSEVTNSKSADYSYSYEYKYEYKTKNGHVVEEIVKRKYNDEKDFTNSSKSTYKYKTFKY